MNIGNVLAKTAGVIGASVVLVDSHYAGKRESHHHAQEKKASSLTEHYLDELKLDSPSVVKSNIKFSIELVFIHFASSCLS